MGLDPKLACDWMSDFIHIAQARSGPEVLVVHPEQPYSGLRRTAGMHPQEPRAS